VTCLFYLVIKVYLCINFVGALETIMACMISTGIIIIRKGVLFKEK
jgi:hypothetical protein